jgi:adenylate kinase family enzyme
MDNGDLIDDNIVISVLSEKVENLNNEQILIDGFPRSSIQAESLNNIFKIY